MIKCFSDKKHVVIVGGGTAGWLTARHFARHENEFNVTLIESEEISPIGVGEGSWPGFKKLIDSDGIELSLDLGGTHKFGINYLNWYTNQSSKYNNWTHPFFATNDALNKIRNGNYKFEEWMHPDSPYLACHFDSFKLQEVYKNLCVNEWGIDYIKSTVEQCEFTESGNISSVKLSDGREIKGDFFVDCTGFKRVLLSNFDYEYVDLSDTLICDKALVTHIDGQNSEKGYYTKATALSSGWSWNIPLRDKTGVGYVYSSQFISDDDAKREFDNLLDDDIDYRIVPFTTGFVKNSWINNCVAVGLSSAFFEPMEATSITQILLQLTRVLSIIRQQDYRDMISRYNQVFTEQSYNIRDYIFSHYKYSDRNDSMFWNNVRNIPIPTDLDNRIKEYIDIMYTAYATDVKSYYQQRSYLSEAKVRNNSSENFFKAGSWIYMMIGYDWRNNDKMF